MRVYYEQRCVSLFPQDDPLLANLDTMLPVEEDPSVVWEESESMLPGLEEILTYAKQDGSSLARQ